MSCVLRVYNVPNDKTQQQLAEEFNKYNITIDSVELVMKNNTEHAGYALVSFDNENDMQSFASNFQKLRHDLVIYK